MRSIVIHDLSWYLPLLIVPVILIVILIIIYRVDYRTERREAKNLKKRKRETDKILNELIEREG